MTAVKSLEFGPNQENTTSWRDYWEMTKPRVVALMLLTVLVGMYLSTPGWVPIPLLLFTLVGISLSAGSAAVINHLADQKIDAIMARTHNRPMPQGRVSTPKALLFAVLIGVGGLSLLAVKVNQLTAFLTFLSLIGYAFIYTFFLKHATPQNIVIGGLAGAAPPLLGWTAVTNHIDPNALLLVLIIFAWTPPHFWALAIHRREEYKNARVPMLPITHGVEFTKLSILLYTILLTITTLLPFLTRMSGIIYLAAATVLNAIFLYYAIALMRNENAKTAIKTFVYSIFYLLLLFVALLVDHYYLILL